MPVDPPSTSDIGGEFLRAYPHLMQEAELEEQGEFSFETIGDNERQAAERQVTEHLRIVDYDTKEYPVETVVMKYLTRKSDEDNDLFVPDYQRDFTWSVERQSKFIESILVGLPIPYVFVADVSDKEGRLEIVDGSQRIRTLAAFVTNRLKLLGLAKLTSLIGFRFCDLELVRQRRFLRRTIHMIELSEKADEEVRRDIFERINTGSDVLRDMEVRRGIVPGPFLTLIEECAANPLFRELAPLSPASEKRREREELVLRFFAYLDNYEGFEKRVREFLDDYLKATQGNFDRQKSAIFKDTFLIMLEFVRRVFPNGFKKAANHKRTPHIRFEAIAVGSALALRQCPDLHPAEPTWLDSAEFKKYTTSDSSNSKPKVKRRIEYVRDCLLKDAK
jgi:hypothetical protein